MKPTADAVGVLIAWSVIVLAALYLLAQVVRALV